MKIHFVILALIIWVASPLTAQDDYTLLKVGDRVPAFTFESAPGVKANISDYQGKVVVITFFATWCGPCRAKLPHIDRDIYGKYGQGNQVVFLTFGREHDWDTVLKFKADQEFKLPFHADQERKVFALFAAQNIPRNFVIDKQGKIAYSSVGFNQEDFDKMKAEIDRLAVR